MTNTQTDQDLTALAESVGVLDPSPTFTWRTFLYGAALAPVAWAALLTFTFLLDVMM